MPKSKVAFIHGLNDNIVRQMVDVAGPNIEVVPIPVEWPEDKKLALAKDADFILTANSSFTMDMLRACPKMRFIQLLSAGFEYVDVKVVGERGIPVANNGGSNGTSVAEHAIALMLAVYKQLVPMWKNVEAGKWRSGLIGEDEWDIEGKTVGIIGLGRIGGRVAERLRGWECKVVYYDVVKFPASRDKELNVRPVSLDELLRTSDIVSVHVPLNDQTRGMIGEREFGLMKRNAIFINTCRGPVHNEAALIKALREKRIAAAGLDVLEQEPTPLDNPLLKMSNVVVTPHLAGASMDTWMRSARFGFGNIQRFLKGEKPESLVYPS